ncbi:MAG: hypothetical protein A3J93_04115 [Candidatus Magasanikbacteria bacterium RIFOXYC2_FULL_42_28]|uniref:Methyltransferase FkbM domain-containing protein n=1 Tax=Candidatus Magasanikbacteria bacterium RIFOXYC2_FULL_42_28 TaxID=1798704 RepID=A0A1F6NWW3_9BACT|nr:MAG: hypothetical protein A3J93_04115 [Candidatus Magasanikbacteria bacterium RIFOXYC2_FULL_42_28]
MLRNLNFEGHKITFEERDEVDRSVAAEIFKFREYRAAEPVIKSAKTIIDVGAHVGLFSLYCLALNPAVKVIALEPEPNNFARLTGTLALNSVTSVRATPLALAAKTGQARLLLAPDSHNHHLVPKDDPGEGISVKTASLSGLRKQEKLGPIDLIKMDIEGGEYEVVASWTPTDFASVKNIILEYHDTVKNGRKILEKIFRENGFGVQTFPNKFCRRLGFIWANNKRK